MEAPLIFLVRLIKHSKHRYRHQRQKHWKGHQWNSDTSEGILVDAMETRDKRG